MQTQAAIDVNREYERAEKALDLNRPDMAIEAAMQILAANPHDADAYNLLGRAQLKKGDNPAARGSFEKSLAIDPNNVQAVFLLACLAWDEKRVKDAGDLFDESLRLNPYNDVIYHYYASFLLDQEKDLPRARGHAMKALELDPSNARNHLLVGNILAREGELDEAETVFQQALKMAPDDPETHHDYGRFLLTGRNQPDAAFAYLREAIRQEPDDPQIRETFLYSLKARNRFYGVFWTYSLMLDRLGKARWLVIIGAYIVVKFMIRLARENPDLMPFVLPIAAVYFLFCIYTWLADPLFNFMIRRGWIR